MPLPSLANDLAYILADVGVSVTHGDVSTEGKLRRTTVEGVGDGGLEKIATRVTLIVRADILSNPQIDDTITVDGTDYLIRDIDGEQPDGSVLINLVPST
jgi:hypothetical protein